MRILILLTTLWLCAVLLPGRLGATHVIGGELTYECLGNDQYALQLTVYRDCENGVPPFDSLASISIYNYAEVFDPSQSPLYQLLVPYLGSDTIPVELADPCLVVPPGVCIERTIYRDTILLPFAQGGYQLAYQRCCRNGSIVNIQSPLTTGASYAAEISETSLSTCNSAPAFVGWPSFFQCVNEPIVFDHSATDADGDSVAYRLYTPFDGADIGDPMPQPSGYPGPADTVAWVVGFGANDVFGSPMTLAIDPVTGLLTGTPTQLGQYVVGVAALEYRNGQLIGATRRDFQFNIGTCGAPSSAFFAPQVICNSYVVSVANQSTNQDTVIWDFGDPLGNDRYSTYNAMHTYGDTGTYTITLIVGNTALTCTDTLQRTVSLRLSTLQADFDYETLGCIDDTEVQFTGLVSDPVHGVAQVEWVFNNTDTSYQLDPLISTPAQVINVQLTATSNNGCRKVVQEAIAVPFYPLNTVDTVATCGLPGIVLNPGGSQELLYTWSPGASLHATDVASPIATPTETTTYQMVATSPDGACTEVRDITVVVISEPSVVLPMETTSCSLSLDLTAEVLDGRPGQYLWFDLVTGDTLAVTTSPSVTLPIAQQVTPIAVEFADAYGCRDEAFTIVTPGFVSSDTYTTELSCFGDTVIVGVENLDPTQTLSYAWTDDVSILSPLTDSAVIVQPDAPTLLTVLLTNQIGCSRFDTVALDMPTGEYSAQASASPLTIDLGESSTLSVTSPNNIVQWSWLPTDSLTAPNAMSTEAWPTQTTLYTVVGIDSLGCRVSDTITVEVLRFGGCEPSSVYVPTAFSPNGDGFNDVLYVRSNTLTEVYFEVYSRWGERVFATDDLTQGWDGTYKGEPLPPAVFGYQLRGLCIDGLEYVAKGSVSLLK